MLISNFKASQYDVMLLQLSEPAFPGCCRSVSQKEDMLQNLLRFGGSRVGPAGSRAVFQILTSEDPNLCL